MHNSLTEGDEMKRVWCLYRVSTKKQVNIDDDIPMQRNACHQYVKSKKDWAITKELSEKGVSGWSKKINERDALNRIKEGAKKGEFDILLVFMFDRLGRREDETPLVVSFLNENNVEVWSVQEGKRKIDTHSDKLLNYLSFWLSDNESHKTSIRVRESKKQLSERGYFQGGAVPYGYKLIDTEKSHWKNRDKCMKELAINEAEAEVVKLIFSLYIDRHMGYRKIVDFLNAKGYRTRSARLFGVSTIQGIMDNPVYIGRKRYKSFDHEFLEQPYNDKLRMLSDERFKKAADLKNKRREKIKDQNKEGIPLAGKLLFSGLAYCKFCGSKLSGNYLYRKHRAKDQGQYDTNVIYRYRCPLNKGGNNGNHERSIWGAKKYDTLIIDQIKAVIRTSDLSPFIVHALSQKKTKQKRIERNIMNLEREYGHLSKQLNRLYAEIANSLRGESPFAPDQLSLAIEEVNRKITENNTNTQSLKREMETETVYESATHNLVNEIDKWEEKFDYADDELKKALLSQIIERVYLGKDEISIEFKCMLEAFIEG
ncbi:recombinase family protein [Heyndrickxia acidicola]|uniref:Recombinase family protein n=1 Tax=Heyndrickxia acidicola TaxID=209389 RepID=A0ABU6MEK9_9BACI|nr:recombinase family protein [Heyndrickxia acidicola]MED1203110.1 recombinase family protein [Heyndrickxia acidicola]